MRAGNALHTHRSLLRLAFSVGNIFAWLFVFEYLYMVSGDTGVALVHTVLLYALSQTVAALLTPLTARGLRHGMQREMVFSVVTAAAAFVFLGASFQGFFGPLPLVAFAGFAVLLGIYRALYWIPYEIERHEIPSTMPARFSFEILIALVPAFIGSLLVSYGVHESWTLFGAAILMVIALLPLIWIPDRYEGFSWGYRATFGQVIDRAHRRLVFGAISDGIQGASLLLIWPLAIFLVVGWSYELLGILLSITLLVLLVVRDGMPGFTRRVRVLGSLPVRVAIVSSAWIGRILVFNPISIIVADAYLHTGNPKISTDHNTFEQVSDAGHFVDEYTVLREIGLLIGRILLCIIFALVASTFSLFIAFGTAFVIAGIAAGLSVIVSNIGHSSI